VLALQGDFAAHGAALAAVGGTVRWVRGVGDLEGLQGLVLPGGESTTMLKLLTEEGLAEPLRQFARRHPVFATCAGAILLAQRVRQPEQASLGLLDVTILRNAYGRQLESSIRKAQVRPEFQAELGADELEAVLIRAPQFAELGPGVEVVAEEAGQPVLVRQGKLIAATFHPELSGESTLHRWFLNLIQSA
ncbi:MAG TPA: pyridoxal 5'-phosphate synthase glutaminase subunit PdxT, partial [Terriglobales bacterium]|nr:pyridoxal 5'-phosphate synthase glutaminase subunit PdxT [Terriglobales bacterium]